MSYQIPPPAVPPQFPSYNPSTPPPPPPKPSTQQRNPPQSNQQPPALPPYPSQSGPSHTQWYDPQRSAGTGYRETTPHQSDPPYRYENTREFAAGQQYQTVPEDGWIPDLLQDKSIQDLEALLQNPTLLHALIHNPSTTHPSLPASLSPLLPLLHINTALATRILTLITTVSSARQHTTAHLHSVRALEQQWKLKQAELERKLEPWGPRELHQRLGAAIVEGEAVCRGVEESFLEGTGVAGEREVGEWVRRVREGRRGVALRRERKGRWDEGRVGGWR